MKFDGPSPELSTGPIFENTMCVFSFFYPKILHPAGRVHLWYLMCSSTKDLSGLLMGLIYLTQLSHTLCLFDNLKYTKYILPDRFSDEDFIKNRQSTSQKSVRFWGVKNGKKYA